MHAHTMYQFMDDDGSCSMTYDVDKYEQLRHIRTSILHVRTFQADSNQSSELSILPTS